jgi:hypothetical protein
VSQSFSIRLIQADYIAARFKFRGEAPPDIDENNELTPRDWKINHNKLNLSFGVVFRFGKP